MMETKSITIIDAVAIAMVNFTDVDVVRHPLVARIVRAYDRHDRKRHKKHDESDA